jgi:hypothetical protein
VRAAHVQLQAAQRGQMRRRDIRGGDRDERQLQIF